MKGVGEFRNVLALEIYKSVNAFDFTKKYIIGFAEGYRAYKILIFQCIQISPSFLR